MTSHSKFLTKNRANIEEYLLISLNSNVYNHNETEPINGIKSHSINLNENNLYNFRYHIIRKENM